MTSIKLMDHQVADAKFLAERSFAGCFNGMGTGKTLTALEATRRVDPDRVVIVAPPIALPMWKDEALNWLVKGVQILKTGSTKIAADTDVIVVSYAIAAKRAQELGRWADACDGKNVLICDESHALKNTKAKRTQAILGRGGLASAFDHAWMLTGTPMTRWADDLIPFLFRAAPQQIKDTCGGGELNIERFRMKFCHTVERQFPGARWPVKMVVGNRNEDELGRIMAQCSTRRELSEVWDAMPPLTFTRLPLSPKLDKDTRELIKVVDKMTVRDIEELLRSGDGHLSTLRRALGMSIIGDAAAFVHERIDAGAGPVLVGAWHQDVIAAMVEAMQAKKIDDRSVRVASLTGQTSAARKEELVRAFNEGELDVLVGQIASMGVSLNLQKGGNNIVVIEEDWSPTIMDQFYARLHRFGQEKAVHVDTLHADVKLMEVINRISHSKKLSDRRMAAAQEGAA
jgi:hypothetical protein